MSNKISTPLILTEAGKALGAAALVNIALFLLMSTFNWIDPSVDIGGGNKITMVAVLLSTLFGCVGGTLVYLLLSRFSQSPGKIFTRVCIVVFILALANPFLAIKAPEAGVLFKVCLDFLHIAPAYFLWRYLTRLG